MYGNDDLDDQDRSPVEDPLKGKAPLFNKKDFPIKEHPATRKRRRERQFSRDYGWIWDFWESVVQWYFDLWTPNFIAAIGYGIYGLCMCGIVAGIIYAAFYSPDRPHPRVIPTVDDVMHLEQKTEDGPPSAPRMENDKTNENK